MAGDPRPSYQFEFLSGLSVQGEVKRSAFSVDNGQAERIRYELDDAPLAANLGRSMPANVADFIDVSAAAFIADRLAPRQVAGDRRSPGDRWHRRIRLVVPVRHPELWQQPEVIACLEKLLTFLTDDSWSFEFIPRTCLPRPSEAQVPLLQMSERIGAVTLLSGGLDSLFGLDSLLRNRQGSAILPVTVVTNERVQRAVASIIGEIRQSGAILPQQVLPARLHVEISGMGRPRDDKESTWRARAMLFLASGVGTAAMAGTDQLWVCENGVGAIGLPMAADHWGSRSTRAMHPRTLNLLGGLASLVLGRPVSIENLGFFVTKGELGQEFARGPFKAAARQTISCDRSTYLGRGEACGKCTSCILRRVSLIAANMDDLAGGDIVKYRTDLLDSEATWNRENILHLLAMRHQVERLREATSDMGGSAALYRAFPDLFEVVAFAPTFGMTESEVEERLRHLYGAYVSEFDSFVAKIDRPGWGRKAIVTELFQTPAKAVTG